MQNLRFVGLDVHKDIVVIAIAEADASPPQVFGTFPNEPASLVKRLKKLGAAGTLRCCYEAGPTGLGLHRALKEAGITCSVVAPSLVPKKAGDRVKTDRRDAAKLARFLRSGDLTEIHVLDEQTEAMRDLERARDDANKAERVARHQLSKFLLRHSRSYAGRKGWSDAHMDWIRRQQFEQEAHNRVLVEYVRAVEEASARVERLTKDIVELVEDWHLKPVVRALQSLCGVQVLTAVIFTAEIGDFARFATAPQLMAYLGLVPSEHSSGQSKRRGGVTRTGNRHVRRILVESAWSYRFRPTMSSAIRKRNEGVAPEIQAIASKAQHRLHGRYKKLLGKGKTSSRRGAEVDVSEAVGMSRTFHVEARAGAGCRSETAVSSHQNYARVIGCVGASMAAGALGGVVGAKAAGADSVGTEALIGLGIGSLVGLVCLLGGHEAPSYVDVDVNDCAQRHDAAAMGISATVGGGTD